MSCMQYIDIRSRNQKKFVYYIRHIIVNGLPLIYCRNLHVTIVYYVHWSMSSIVPRGTTSRSIGILRNSTRGGNVTRCAVAGRTSCFLFAHLSKIEYIYRKVNRWRLMPDPRFKITSMISPNRTRWKSLKTKVSRTSFVAYYIIYNNFIMTNDRLVNN